MTVLKSFSYKDTNLRVTSAFYDEMVEEVVQQRKILERYIHRHSEFVTSLTPVTLPVDAPEIAVRMNAAGIRTGLGPMAAVAGILAQYGVEKAVSLGAEFAIIENGGDMFIVSDTPVHVGIYAGDEWFKEGLAFKVETSPLAICSSSSRMGHSLSLGNCSLATVVSRDAALADSAATLLCNSISSPADLKGALERVECIEGVRGALAMVDGKIGLVGTLPSIVKNADDATLRKITRDRRSGAH